jgi:hypothetical protein
VVPQVDNTVCGDLEIFLEVVREHVCIVDSPSEFRKVLVVIDSDDQSKNGSGTKAIKITAKDAMVSERVSLIGIKLVTFQVAASGVH